MKFDLSKCTEFHSTTGSTQAENLQTDWEAAALAHTHFHMEAFLCGQLLGVLR